jgi:putative DNA primase/helicase
MLDIALYYARSGYPVFPLVPGDKIPLIPREKGGHGFKDATTSAALIDQWWTQEPEANIGIATGIRSNLLVIDIDPRKNTNWLAELNRLSLPPTYTVRTWSRGYHLYFRYPKGCGISCGANVVPGIDWRGEGGYVVAPGSVVNGALYEIVKSEAIAHPPSDLVALLKQSSKKKARVLETRPDGRMVIPYGNRNEHLYRIACAIRRWGIDVDGLLGCLRVINAEHCSPQMADDELELIATSAATQAPDASASK